MISWQKVSYQELCAPWTEPSFPTWRWSRLSGIFFHDCGITRKAEQYLLLCCCIALWCYISVGVITFMLYFNFINNFLLKYRLWIMSICQLVHQSSYYLFVTADVRTVQVCIMGSELIHIKFCSSVLDNLLVLNNQTRS